MRRVQGGGVDAAGCLDVEVTRPTGELGGDLGGVRLDAADELVVGFREGLS